MYYYMYRSLFKMGLGLGPPLYKGAVPQDRARKSNCMFGSWKGIGAHLAVSVHFVLFNFVLLAIKAPCFVRGRNHFGGK